MDAKGGKHLQKRRLSEPYSIPLRSLYSKNIDNLMFAGRNISASHIAFSSTRVMGTCAIGGQAFGTAAAQLIENGKTDIREVDISALQETLLRDDCYLPGRRNADEKDLARTATVTATTARVGYEAEKVISGVSRREGSETNAWRSEGLSEGGETLTLALAASAKVRTVQLTLDSNFDLEKKITLSSRRQNQQVVGIPAELLKDFDVVLYRNGEVVAEKQVRGNYQRLCRVAFDAAECDTVAIRALATNGTPDARVFEVRIYE
jgi:hypothetical protein